MVIKTSKQIYNENEFNHQKEDCVTRDNKKWLDLEKFEKWVEDNKIHLDVSVYKPRDASGDYINVEKLKEFLENEN